jgi:hypothetical protein
MSIRILNLSRSSTPKIQTLKTPLLWYFRYSPLRCSIQQCLPYLVSPSRTVLTAFTQETSELMTRKTIKVLNNNKWGCQIWINLSSQVPTAFLREKKSHNRLTKQELDRRLLRSNAFALRVLSTLGIAWKDWRKDLGRKRCKRIQLTLPLRLSRSVTL